jgi:hypothetical protein
LASQIEHTDRGLPSLNQARADRRRAIAFGRVRLRGMPPQFWLWTAFGMAVFGVTYWRIAAGQLESQKSAVMAKQRAITKTLGPRIIPFADRIETWAADLAGPWKGDVINSGTPWDSIAQKPGIYLRLRIEDAVEKDKLRPSSMASLHDGFTSCFFVGDTWSNATEGPKCERNANCEPGMLCNDWEVCTRPPRPYNMRLAYRALRVLSNDWTNQLHEASSDLEVRAKELDLDQVTRVDVPVAIELMQQAKFATIVLDEAPDAKVLAANGALPGESAEARVQRLPHAARVGIWNLANESPVVRWRGRAEGRLVAAGRPVKLGPDTVAAQARQANSCMLAWDLRDEITKLNTTARPDSDVLKPTEPSSRQVPP